MTKIPSSTNPLVESVRQTEFAALLRRTSQLTDIQASLIDPGRHLLVFSDLDLSGQASPVPLGTAAAEIRAFLNEDGTDPTGSGARTAIVQALRELAIRVLATSGQDAGAHAYARAISDLATTLASHRDS